MLSVDNKSDEGEHASSCVQTESNQCSDAGIQEKQTRWKALGIIIIMSTPSTPARSLAGDDDGRIRCGGV